MATIKQDIVGIYLIAGSAIVRPDLETQFKVGDRVKTYVRPYCTDVRVEKDGVKEFWTRGLRSYFYDVFQKYLDKETFEELLMQFRRFDEGNPIANIGRIPKKPFDRQELHLRVATNKAAENIWMANFKQDEAERAHIIEISTPALIIAVDKYLTHTKNI